MEVIYRVNGKEFNTKEQAMDYEVELQEQEQKRIEKEQQRKARLEEVETARQHYYDVLQKYLEDYEVFISVDDYDDNDDDDDHEDDADIIQSILELFK